MRSLILFFLAVSLSLASTVQAQFRVTPPDDVANFDPSSDDSIPDRIDDIILPRVQFIFDELLDPDRLSLVEFVTTDNINDPRLNDAVRSIIRNHIIAMQQVELSIQFLQANRNRIIAGESKEFNSVFGTVGVKETVAVLSPSPLAGTASLQQGGQNNALSLMFMASQGGGGGGGGQGGGVDTTQPNVASQVLPGDVLFVEDPAAVNAMTGITTTSQVAGIVVRVLAVMGNDPASAVAQGGQGGGGNNMQELLLDPDFGTASSTMTTFANARVFPVIRFEEQVDSTRYERVLATFRGIRDSLAGLDPNITAGGGLQQALATPISYNRRFTDINMVWAPGVAEFTELNQTVSDFMTSRHPTNLVSTRGADRLVRQGGFSSSDSHFHIDRLEDQANRQATDYLGNDTFPLLWTEDNVLPLNVNDNGIVLGSTDDQRAFFRDRQTMFGEPDFPWTQHLGRAFFEETINHPSFFFDDAIAADGLAQETREAQRPVRSGTFLTVTVIDANGMARQVRQIDVTTTPESGDPRQTETEFKRWQMMIESFAEFSTDFTLFNNAAVGISEMFGGFAPGDFSARDAGNYGRFAFMIGGNSLGGIDPARIEPFGKRASAGFNPVVSPF